MNQRPYYNPRKPKFFVTANHHIRYPQVRVLTDTGEALGVMSSQEALQKARDAGKDLVLITEQAQPPVVKIIELSKHKYQLERKKSQDRKNAKVHDIKEVRLSPFVGEGDFEGKLKKIIGFLEKGHKVRLSLLFKGRTITKKEFGYGVFDRVVQRTADHAMIEMQPKLLGKKLIAQLSPVKKKKTEKPTTRNS